MSDQVLSAEEAARTPCDWNGHRLMNHQWWDTSDGHQRCANCKHVRQLPAEATNAELLRLLARHHTESIARDRGLLPGIERYVGTDLYLKTAAAIGDPLRPRVPVWRCPVCKMKFYSRAEYDAHRAEESALRERV